MLSLRSALSVVTSRPERPGRERLKTALAARDAARHAVSDARATLEGLQAIIRVSDDAARVAWEAARKVNDTRSTWVKSGCPYSGTREIQILEDIASQASRAAESAAQDADAVFKELAKAEDAVRSRESEVRHCEAEISAATGAILAAEATPLIERFERLTHEYGAARLEILSLQRAIRSGDYFRDEGARVIEAAYSRAEIQSWNREREEARACESMRARGNGEQIPYGEFDDPVFKRSIENWRARAEALRKDPDAE